ncbi:hypothetical protein TRVA0_011S01244 [Trichomonascus vanleenenianus]|uniref:SET domain-containing protein n=1 Tax=Trichomonascus vanleenenianus TaxID=2268995 RepID=UPI003EC9A3F5
MLTYIDLAYFDDLLVDCFIDRIHYWATTRKVREYKPIRGIPKGLLMDIIQENVIQKSPSINTAVERFVTVPSVKNFLGRFQDPSVRNEFERHVKRYVSIYMPECGFAVEVTDRYTSRSKTVEACVVARRVYQPGEEIKHLVGFLAHLTDDDEEQLNKSNGKDFSIINSSRLGVNCMMLGPARFVNHDCDASARFSSAGRSMSIFAKRKISVGEEITVEYSQNYFGRRNRECLCATCEGKSVNGFDKNKPEEDEAESSDEEDSRDEIRNFRRKSKKESATTKSTIKGEPTIKEELTNLSNGVTNTTNATIAGDTNGIGNINGIANSIAGRADAFEIGLASENGETLENRESGTEKLMATVQKLDDLSTPPNNGFQYCSGSPPTITKFDDDDNESVSSKMSDSLLSSRQVSSVPSPSTSIEPDTEESQEDKQQQTQGRSLRPRRSAGPPNGSYKLSTMIKRKLVVIPELSRDAIMRQVSKYYKTYFRTPYEAEHESTAQTCWNCHVKFLRVIEDKKVVLQRMLRKYCPRCHRHVILYSAFWPSPRKEQEPIELYYDPIFERPPTLKDEEEEEEEEKPKPKRKYTRREVPKKKWVPLPAVVDEPKKSKRPRRLSVWLKKRRRDDRYASSDGRTTKRSKSAPN